MGGGRRSGCEIKGLLNCVTDGQKNGVDGVTCILISFESRARGRSGWVLLLHVRVFDLLSGLFCRGIDCRNGCDCWGWGGGSGNGGGVAVLTDR